MTEAHQSPLCSPVPSYDFLSTWDMLTRQCCASSSVPKCEAETCRLSAAVMTQLECDGVPEWQWDTAAYRRWPPLVTQYGNLALTFNISASLKRSRTSIMQQERGEQCTQSLFVARQDPSRVIAVKVGATVGH